MIQFPGRFHAFVIAHKKDKNSTGRGVRQFKTALLQRLEQVNENVGDVCCQSLIKVHCLSTYYSYTGVCAHTHNFKVAISLIVTQLGIISIHRETEV